MILLGDSVGIGGLLLGGGIAIQTNRYCIANDAIF